MRPSATPGSSKGEGPHTGRLSFDALGLPWVTLRDSGCTISDAAAGLMRLNAGDHPLDELVNAARVDDRQPLRQAISQAMSTGAELSHSFRVAPGGPARAVLIAGRPVPARNAQTEPCIAAVLADLTPHLPGAAPERTLHESRERFRVLTQAMPQLVWTCDAQGLCTFLSAQWERYTGQSCEEGLGLVWLERIHPEDRERVWKAWSSAVKAHREFLVDYRLRGRDGSYRWFLVRAVAIESPDPATAWIGTSTDIEDRKRAEAMLATYQERLEVLVDQRTEELRRTHQRLRMAERMASIGTLAAGIGHDMANLMIPARIRVNALRGADLPAGLARDVDALASAIDYLSRLAGSLRLLAVDPENPGLAEERTDLRRWWEQSSTLLRSALPPGVVLEGDLGASPPDPAITPAALTQVVLNLVQNAGEAMRDRGHGAVRVSVSAQASTVTFSIRDDGPGMPEEVRARCAEPYFSTKNGAHASGLGLWLVQTLVERAGGSVAIESEPGRGTCFRVTLPVAHDPAGSQRRAFVELRDPRWRALVVGELRALRYDITTDPAQGRSASLSILDSAPRRQPASDPAQPGARSVVFADQAPAPFDPAVVYVGRNPRLALLRETFRQLSQP